MTDILTHNPIPEPTQAQLAAAELLSKVNSEIARRATANNRCSVAFGYESVTTGADACAIGQRCTASGDAAISRWVAAIYGVEQAIGA